VILNHICTKQTTVTKETTKNKNKIQKKGKKKKKGKIKSKTGPNATPLAPSSHRMLKPEKRQRLGAKI
jgi:hypothetical protein